MSRETHLTAARLPLYLDRCSSGKKNNGKCRRINVLTAYLKVQGGERAHKARTLNFEDLLDFEFRDEGAERANRGTQEEKIER